MAFSKRIIGAIKNILIRKKEDVLSPRQAYDEWAETYDFDAANNNLTVFYNNLLVDELLKKVNIEGKIVCDFGAGTGNHYQKICQYQPSRWLGCDISQEMLNVLKEKLPHAEVYKIDNHQLNFLKDQELDILFSSLTLGYVKNIEDALSEWNRVLKPGGNIVLSMFHPSFTDGKTARSFKSKQGKVRIIESYQYPESKLEELFETFKWQVILKEEVVIDSRAIPKLEKMNKSEMYNDLAGKPLIIGYVLNK